MKIHCLTVFCPLFLTACMGVYDDEFDCGVGKGVGCRSISQVNEMVNQGQVPLKETEESEEDTTINIEAMPSLEPLAAQQGIKVKRIPEKTVRIWVAPHEAQDGSFVEESYVNLVIEPGRWVNIPAGDF
jgi:conjugal transfer pilus assembly protein TraV